MTTTRQATRYPSLFERLVANTREEGDCWIWTGAVRTHYPSMTVRIPGRPHPVPVRPHRVMLDEAAELAWSTPGVVGNDCPF